MSEDGLAVVLDGTDAMKWWQELANKKAIKIEAANGKETDFKPMIKLSLVENV